jgi:hypothetical protein
MSEAYGLNMRAPTDHAGPGDGPGCPRQDCPSAAGSVIEAAVLEILVAQALDDLESGALSTDQALRATARAAWDLAHGCCLA